MTIHQKPITCRTVLLTMLAVLAATCSQLAGAAGLLTPKQSTDTPPEIRQHHVDVTIEDGYAITSVTQVFYNPNPNDIEAVYAFPVPAKASVGEFTYWIDGKPVTGEVVEKERAQEIYATEKAHGRETAITVKDEYKTFDTLVYPVRGQQEVRIRLVYIQPVHVDSSVGRYVYPLQEGGVDEEQLAFWSYNEVVTEAFSFDLKLRSSHPVDDVRLPQHGEAVPTRVNDKEWTISLANGSAAAAEEPGSSTAPQAVHTLDEDIVVYWRLEQGLPGSVDLVTYKEPDKRQGTFMLTLTPADDLKPIAGGRDWIFVLDCSGSMQVKYASLVDGVRRGLGKLRPDDRFRIILFNNHARELTSGFTPVTQDQVDHYLSLLDNHQPDGGTNLYDGLETGMRSLDSDRASALLLVTDGVANVGVTEKKAFLDLLEKNDVRLFTFVMGNSANRPLLEGMTRVSQGFSMNVSSSDDIAGNVLLAADKLTHEAMRDIDIRINGVEVRHLTPTTIGSLYRGQQLILLGHYFDHGTAQLRVTGKAGTEDIEYEAELAFPETAITNPEIERLWAFATIEDLQDRMEYFGEDADSKQAIVDIATKYGLVTDYTSLIVVREELFNQYGIDRTNKSRIESEHDARAMRSSAPIANHAQRTGTSLGDQRAYPGNGGAGSVGPFLPLIIIVSLLMIKVGANRAR